MSTGDLTDSKELGTTFSKELLRTASSTQDRIQEANADAEETLKASMAASQSTDDMAKLHKLPPDAVMLGDLPLIRGRLDFEIVK